MPRPGAAEQRPAAPSRPAAESRPAPAQPQPAEQRSRENDFGVLAGLIR
jgi:hypothetical protein